MCTDESSKAMANQQVLSTAMKSATKVLQNANKANGLGEMQQTLQNFQKESMQADMTEEISNYLLHLSHLNRPSQPQ
jgi:hypothetical protein